MPSFDVVCELDLQEIDNAVNQTLRELGNRFDFKGTTFEVRREEHTIHLLAQDDFKLRALSEILQERLAKRQVPLKAIQAGTPEPGPSGTAKQKLDLQNGITTDKAREIVKLVKDAKLKVQAAVQGAQVRISGKKRDDLQQVMQMLRGKDLEIAMQFVNFRD
jgi:cyclic-di-GMP-binding protein